MSEEQVVTQEEVDDANAMLGAGYKVGCVICKKATLSSFNIKFRAVPVCERCANVIFLQQARHLVRINEVLDTNG